MFRRVLFERQYCTSRRKRNNKQQLQDSVHMIQTYSERGKGTFATAVVKKSEGRMADSSLLDCALRCECCECMPAASSLDARNPGIPPALSEHEHVGNASPCTDGSNTRAPASPAFARGLPVLATLCPCASLRSADFSECLAEHFGSRWTH